MIWDLPSFGSVMETSIMLSIDRRFCLDSKYSLGWIIATRSLLEVPPAIRANIMTSAKPKDIIGEPSLGKCIQDPCHADARGDRSLGGFAHGTTAIARRDP